LPRPGEQAGSQDSHQGERADGHRHQVRLWQEAVEAIFRKDKQPQGRQLEDVPEASAQRGTKEKGEKKLQAKRDAADADLVTAAEHRNPRKPPAGANLFDKMLKESCPYHQGTVKHTLEECVMLQRYFHKAGPPTEGGRAHDNDKKEGHKAEEFPEVHDRFMIYGGQVANASARHRKQERREVCSVKVAAPVYLDWTDKPITFDQSDHPDRVPSPGKYPLVVDPVIGNVRLTKVFMDGGSSLNIIYAETLGLLQIGLSTIRAGAAPFHGIIPGKHVQPLGQLDLPVYFGTPSNFRKETLTFEVVGFRGTYHAVLGRPCFAKFMAVPNYTYLKLKMSGPNGVITVGSTYRHVYECDVECVEYAEALVESEALIADLESLSKEVPDAKRHAGNSTSSSPTWRAPQAHSSLGRAVHHRQDLEARNIQVGQQSRRGLQQRLEHPTATSLLPLKCFQVVHMPCSYANKV
jgi:hypothetical protein